MLSRRRQRIEVSHSPDYQTEQKYIPATGKLTGHPEPQGEDQIWMQLFVPVGAKPAGGWPVAIFGHSFGDSVYGAPFVAASGFASRGIATLSINVVPKNPHTFLTNIALPSAAAFAVGAQQQICGLLCERRHVGDRPGRPGRAVLRSADRLRCRRR